MSDAYQCDRCDEYNGGSGSKVRYGIYEGTRSFNSEYDFEYKAELCDDCKEELDTLIDDFAGGSDE